MKLRHFAMVDKNVPRKVAPASRDALSRVLTATSVAARTSFCRARNLVIVNCLADTGIRREELTWIRCQDVRSAREQGGRLPIRTSKREGHPHRQVPLAPETLRFLEDFMNIHRAMQISAISKQGRADKGWLFCTRSGGKMAAATITQLFGDLRSEAGIKGRMTAHMLRHRYITLQVVTRLRALHHRTPIGLEALTTVLSQVASLSGHASIDSLWTYVDWAYEELAETATDDTSLEIQAILKSLAGELDPVEQRDVIATLEHVRGLLGAKTGKIPPVTVAAHERFSGPSDD